METGKVEITVKVFGGLREAVGVSEQRVRIEEPATLQDLLEHLGDGSSALGQILREKLGTANVYVLLNGRSLRFPEAMEARLCTGDVVSLLPPVSGG